MKYLRTFNENNGVDPNRVEILCQVYLKDKDYRYEIREDGKVDLTCDSVFHIQFWDKPSYPIKFNSINFNHSDGRFNIFNCPNLQSLDFLPRDIQGNLVIIGCPKLTSLEGCSESCVDFTLVRCGVTSLEGGPKYVGGFYRCEDNKLTSLKGAPREVPGKFDSGRNAIKSLVGGPESVGGDYRVDFCPFLTTLEGVAKHIGGDLDCHCCYDLKDPGNLRDSDVDDMLYDETRIRTLIQVFGDFSTFKDSLDYNYIRRYEIENYSGRNKIQRVCLNYFRISQALDEFDIPMTKLDPILNHYPLVDDEGVWVKLDGTRFES